MWLRLAGVCLSGLFGLAACGETNDNPQSMGGASSAGSAGATAGGGATSSGGAGANAGGKPSGGGSESKAGGSSGGGASGGEPAAPTAVPDIECGFGEVVYEGTVGGVAVNERLQLTGPAAGISLVGAFSGGISSILPDGTTVAGADRLQGGVLVFPAGSAHAGEIWCIDEGSLLSKSNQPAGALVGHLLGKCPGTAVAGTLHACFDSSQGYCDDQGEAAKRSLGGELAGKTLESPAVGLTSLSSQAWASGTTLFYVMLFAASAPSMAAPAKVSGFLVAAEANPDLGDVYCVGDGEWKTYSDDFVNNADVATLTQISYVGSCKDTGPTESLNVCIGY